MAFRQSSILAHLYNRNIVRHSSKNQSSMAFRQRLVQMGERIMIKYSVILCFILLPLMAQDRWAIIIGITEYPYWLGKLPILSSPAKDAQIIKHSLLSPECEFAEQKVFTLINQQAQKDNINAALDCIQQNAKPGDSLIFIFIGHGFFREDRYFLLCYDGNSDDVAASNISLDSLANRLESLPCQKIAFFLDCHRSK